MATPTESQLETEVYTISDSHDLVIRLFEYDDHDESKGPPKKVCEYKVERDVLTGESPYFRRMLSGNFKESGKTAVELHGDSPVALTICLRLMHDAVIKETYDVGIGDIWYMLLASHKYELNPKADRAKAWFAECYEVQKKRMAQGHAGGWRFDYVAYQQLLLPFYTFDHAQGFQAATKFLVYNGEGHIVEQRPKGFHYDYLRLTHGVIQQVNAARGRLKTILHRALYQPIYGLVMASCDHKEKVLFAYEKRLCNTRAWPLETSFQKNSVAELLEKLKAFPQRQAVQLETCGRGSCSFDFEEVVRKAVVECETSFDGLCLDCMDSSNPKLGDSDEDYWEHDKMKLYDKGCRITHGQPTWFFSFMGRAEKKIQWVKQKMSRFDRY